MEPKHFNLAELPPELLSQVLDFSKESEVKLVDKKANELVSKLFEEANREITRLYPPLERIVTEQHEKTSSIKLFMRLINNLHAEAKRLGCDIAAPKGDDEEKISWEWNNFQGLAKEINKRTEILKVQAFNSFVEAFFVKERIGLEEPLDLSEMKINKTDPDYHQKVWQYLIKNKKEQLEKIELLELSRKELCFLPPEIGQLIGLKALILDGNKLTDLSPEIVKLNQLGIISLDNNQFTSFPSVLCNLKLLTIVSLVNNKLQTLPSEINKLQRLEILGLIGNQLTSLPVELFDIKSLTELHLATNQINALPSEIDKLKNLRVLVLAENQLTTLPPGIGQLKLQQLMLSSNPLKSLPEEMVNLSVEYFDLEHFNLAQLNDVMAQASPRLQEWLKSRPEYDLKSKIPELKNKSNPLSKW